MDLATFRAQYPEFMRAPDALVAGKLADAANRMDAALYADSYEEAHGLLTAHLVAMSPFGTNARLDPKASAAMGAATTYEATWKRLERAAATMVRVF